MDKNWKRKLKSMDSDESKIDRYIYYMWRLKNVSIKGDGSDVNDIEDLISDIRERTQRAVLAYTDCEGHYADLSFSDDEALKAVFPYWSHLKQIEHIIFNQWRPKYTEKMTAFKKKWKGKEKFLSRYVKEFRGINLHSMAKDLFDYSDGFTHHTAILATAVECKNKAIRKYLVKEFFDIWRGTDTVDSIVAKAADFTVHELAREVA